MAGQSQVKLRKFSRIPVFICEYHHDALRFIQKCYGSRHLSMGGGQDTLPQLIHFDAHPDMVVPEIEPALLYDRANLPDELSIENWIIPLCATGLIDRVTWIKQGWARQMPVGEHIFHVGVSEETNRLAVDSTLEYFLGEGNVNLSKDLKEPHRIKLNVMDLEDYEKAPIKQPSTCPIILDVDLDFFSTNNPFWAVYKKAGLYAELQDIYKFTIDHKNLPESLNTRRSQLAYLKSIFMHLEEHKSLEGFADQDYELFARIEYLVKVLDEHYDIQEIDFLLIHDAGCTWDTYGLPDHRSTKEEITEAMERTESYLRTIPDPVIITVSRSSEDDYCPPDQVEMIQEKFLQVLKNVYADRVEGDPIYYYKNTEDNN